MHIEDILADKQLIDYITCIKQLKQVDPRQCLNTCKDGKGCKSLSKELVSRGVSSQELEAYFAGLDNGQDSAGCKSEGEERNRPATCASPRRIAVKRVVVEDRIGGSALSSTSASRGSGRTTHDGEGVAACPAGEAVDARTSDKEALSTSTPTAAAVGVATLGTEEETTSMDTTLKAFPERLPPDEHLKVTPDGLVDISSFRGSPENPNQYTDEEFDALCNDVKRRGGPCQAIGVTIAEDGTVTIFQGHHNHKACLKIGIAAVEPRMIELYGPMTPEQRLRAIYRSNRHGSESDVCLGGLFDVLAQKGMSVREIGDYMGTSHATIQTCLEKYRFAVDLPGTANMAQDVFQTHAELIDKLPRAAVSNLKRISHEQRKELLDPLARPAMW